MFGKVCTKCGQWKLLKEFHKDKNKKGGRQSWCKECTSAYGRQYRAEHREERKAYRRQCREEARAYTRQWQHDNPDKVAAKVHRRRARKAHAEGSFTAKEWQDLCEHYGWECLACGTSHEESPLAADHVVSLSEGGSNWIDNIQPLCRSCNSRKGTKTIDYR